MLEKINHEKLKRQEKTVALMKKRQEEQIQKVRQIEEEQEFEYQEKEKRRAERIDQYMKKSMLSPLKNLEEKESKVFEKQKDPKGTGRRVKASPKAKFNKSQIEG